MIIDIKTKVEVMLKQYLVVVYNDFVMLGEVLRIAKDLLEVYPQCLIKNG